MSMRIHRDQLAFSFEESAALPYTLTCADVLKWAQGYTGPKFHAMLCDPPYHLTELTSLHTGMGCPRTDEQKRYRRATAARGFMGQHWDGGDIAFKPETWKALAQHLLPGAFVMAFASSRGWHRLACALEDGGLIIHPSIFLWTYGSGFPKSTRIHDERFNGHRYGMQAMKPAAEPILLAQAPYQDKPRQSITQTGAGALNIDQARLGISAQDPSWRDYQATATVAAGSHGIYNSFAHGYVPEQNLNPSGRWPPNFALSHTPECVQVGTRQVQTQWSQATVGHADGRTIYGRMDAEIGKPIGYTDANGMEEVAEYRCSDQCPVRLLDAQAGVRTSGGTPFRRNGMGYHGAEGQGEVNGNHGDSGTVSRFFHVSDYALDVAEQLAQADQAFYCAKASRGERDKGLEGMPLQVGFNKNTSAWKADARHHDGGYPNNLSQVRNVHPTIKPIALCRWLATLLLPPAAYAPRRLLVPFCGTGSEMIGALLAGWDEIVGIEQDAAYVEIAKPRLGYWQGRTTWP